MIVYIVTFFLSFLPTFTGLGGSIGSSINSLAGFMVVFDTILPIHETLDAASFMMVFYAVVFAVKFVIWSLVALRILSPGAKLNPADFAAPSDRKQAM